MVERHAKVYPCIPPFFCQKMMRIQWIPRVDFMGMLIEWWFTGDSWDWIVLLWRFFFGMINGDLMVIWWDFTVIFRWDMFTMTLVGWLYGGFTIWDTSGQIIVTSLWPNPGIMDRFGGIIPNIYIYRALLQVSETL